MKTTLLTNVRIDLSCVLDAIGSLDNPAINTLQRKLARLTTRAAYIFSQRFTISRQSLPHSRSRHLRHQKLLSNLARGNRSNWPFLLRPQHNLGLFLRHEPKLALHFL